MIRYLYNVMTRFIHSNWLGGLHAAFVVRSLHTQRFFRRVESRKPLIILDAGCGEQASLTALLSRRYRQHIFVATDLYLLTPLPQEPNLYFVLQDINNPALKGKFDIIYSLDLLEHLENPLATLDTFCRWLRPGGRLFLHVPSYLCATFLKKALEAEYPFHRAVRPGDIHLHDGFPMSDMQQALTQAGFEIISQSYTFHSRLWLFKELYTLGERRRIPAIGLMILPFILVLFWAEANFPPRRGNGFWIETIKLLKTTD